MRETRIFCVMLLLSLLGGSIALAEETTQGPMEPDFTQAPGVVIHHSPAATEQYIGSPSIAILPDGAYVASHDFFGPGSTFDAQGETQIYHSDDKGRTWATRARVQGQFWSTLFVLDDALYLFGVNRAGGAIVIRRSEDQGRTWTRPESANSGLLTQDQGYHTAPVPVVTHDGRIWRIFEYKIPGVQALDAFVLSAPLDADLLDASVWRRSASLSNIDVDLHWWLEGNIVVTPESELAGMMRVVDPRRFELGGKVALLRIDGSGEHLEIDPETPLIDFPGGSKMFVLRYDPESRLYWTLSNAVLEPLRDETTPHEFLLEEKTRNTQVLMASPDLKQWEMRALVCYHPDTVKHGFQYVHWQFEGNDMIAVSRTAHEDGLGGPNNQHDANFLTFHRITDFRNRRMPEAEIADIIAQGKAYDIEAHP